MKFDFELLAIGAGSGGVAACRRAALHGARVAVVEGSRVGGTCVIRGCVPKKLMMYAAQAGDGLREAQAFGWALGDDPAFAFNVAEWVTAKEAETQRLEKVYRQLLLKGNVELIEGWAKLSGPHELSVGTKRLTARHILIASGAATVRDSIPGIERCPTSDEILELTKIPTHVAVVGSGYIAVEFASFLARLGSRVSMFYRADLPLRGFDLSLRSRLEVALKQDGIKLHPRTVPARIEPAQEGYRVDLPGGQSLKFDYLLNATGRLPNTRDLDLDMVGVDVDAKGAILVDDRMHSSVSSVYAIGDVTNRKNLTPVAIAEGRALADNLFASGKEEVNLRLTPSAVFSIPPLASVGATEDELAASGTYVKVFETEFRPLKEAFVNSSRRTYMKLLVEGNSDRVLGVHMLGC